MSYIAQHIYCGIQRHGLSIVNANETYSLNKEMTVPKISCILTTRMKVREAEGTQ